MQSHWWIKTRFTARKCSNRVKTDNFLYPVTLKFDRWPWKTIGPLFYAALSFVHQSILIGEFKLELQSGNPQIKIGDFSSHVTLKFNGWPWKNIAYLFYAASRFVHSFVAISKLKLESRSENAQIGTKLFRLLWLQTLTSDLNLLHGHHFCPWWLLFHDDTTTGTL